MKVFDSFIFFNELDLLEMRLNILGDVVDTFVITESPFTVSGNENPYTLNLIEIDLQSGQIKFIIILQKLFQMTFRNT